MYEIIHANYLVEVKTLTTNQLRMLIQTDATIVGYRRVKCTK